MYSGPKKATFMGLCRERQAEITSRKTALTAESDRGPAFSSTRLRSRLSSLSGTKTPAPEACFALAMPSEAFALWLRSSRISRSRRSISALFWFKSLSPRSRAAFPLFTHAHFGLLRYWCVSKSPPGFWNS